MSGITYENLKNFCFDFKKIDELYKLDLVKARETLQIEMKEKEEAYKKIGKAFKIDLNENVELDIENGELYKYLRERIFPVKGGFLIIEKEPETETEQLNLNIYSKKEFEQIFSKIEYKSKKLAKKIMNDVETIFNLCISNNLNIIDKEKNIINLSKQFNYSHVNIKLNDKEQEQLNEIFDFIKKIICGGNEEQFDCMQKIFSFMANRKKTDIVVSIVGLEGCGKSFLCETLLSAIFGQSLVMVDEKIFSGDNQFNCDLMGVVGAVLEESSGRGEENHLTTMRGIKRISTAKKLKVREMYKVAYDVLNILTIFVLSNFHDLDIKGRRHFAPDLSSEKQGNKKYFARLAEILKNKSICQALFNHFYNYTDVKYIDIPESKTKLIAKDENINSADLFVIQKYIIENPTEREVKTNKLYNEYVMWAKNSGIKQYFQTPLKFSYHLKNYLERVLRADGQEKITSGFGFYDMTREKLYNAYIVRAKVISLNKLEQLKAEIKDEYAEFDNDEKKNKDDDKKIKELENDNLTLKNELAKHAMDIKDKDEEIKDLKEQLEKLKKQFEEGQKQEKKISCRKEFRSDESKTKMKMTMESFNNYFKQGKHIQFAE